MMEDPLTSFDKEAIQDFKDILAAMIAIGKPAWDFFETLVKENDDLDLTEAVSWIDEINARKIRNA